MSFQKLRSRYLPPHVDPGAIPRPVVHARLENANQTSLTLLVAPPGFGKTTALGVWLSQQPAHVAYMAIGPRDAELAGFASVVVGAVQVLAPEASEVLLADLNAETALDGPILAELVVQTLEAVPHDVTLVVDDYHAVTSPEVHAFFGELVRLGLSSLHLVIASRYDPPFPWARLRLDGRLTEVRSQDFALSEPQAAQVLERTGVADPSGALARTVWEQTQGWPAGVRR
ncbi:MAG: hypothetical protein KC442_24795, partial [Thermomicrobiales bacterium]|nr:hypothetical protein [Thermomicrobiales bacterium]